MVVTSTCTSDEYGDHWDAMGHGFLGVGHFNAVQKDPLDWLVDRKRRVTQSGHYRVCPYEASVSRVQALEIKAGARTYWLEYRQPLGVDTWLSSFPGATHGVLIHVSEEGLGSWLLDMTPNSDGWFLDSALPVSHNFHDDENRLTVSVRRVSPIFAKVDIELVTGQ